MDNSIFVDNENKPLVTHLDENHKDDNNYNGFNTQSTTGVGQTTFATLSSTDIQETLTLHLRKT